MKRLSKLPDSKIPKPGAEALGLGMACPLEEGVFLNYY